MATALAEPMLLVFILQQGRVLFQLLCLGLPVDKGVFSKSLKPEVNRLAEILIVENFVRAHIEDKCDVLVIVHIADLLGCSYSNLEGIVHLEEGV